MLSQWPFHPVKANFHIKCLTVLPSSQKTIPHQLWLRVEVDPDLLDEQHSRRGWLYLGDLEKCALGLDGL